MNGRLNGLRRKLDKMEPDPPTGCVNCAGPPVIELADGEREPPMAKCLNLDNCRPVRRICIVHLPPRTLEVMPCEA
jgi:hypothetical protein